MFNKLHYLDGDVGSKTITRKAVLKKTFEMSLLFSELHLLWKINDVMTTYAMMQ